MDFFLSGVFGIVWYFVWLMVVYESPALHLTISDDEKSLIQETALDMSKVGLVHDLWCTSKWAMFHAVFVVFLVYMYDPVPCHMMFSM